MLNSRNDSRWRQFEATRPITQSSSCPFPAKSINDNGEAESGDVKGSESSEARITRYKHRPPSHPFYSTITTLSRRRLSDGSGHGENNRRPVSSCLSLSKCQASLIGLQTKMYTEHLVATSLYPPAGPQGPAASCKSLQLHEPSFNLSVVAWHINPNPILIIHMMKIRSPLSRLPKQYTYLRRNSPDLTNEMRLLYNQQQCKQAGFRRGTPMRP